VLSERGHKVTVVSPIPPSATFSAAAAAVITPLLPWDHRHPSFAACWGWYRRTIDRFRVMNAAAPKGEPLLEDMPSYECGFDHDGERVLEKGFGLRKFQHLPFTKVEVIEFDPPVHVQNHEGESHDCTFCARFVADFCNTERFLENIRLRLVGAGVEFHHRSIKDLAELQSLECDVVFNCTGFNSRALFPDSLMYHVRGQSMFVDSPNCAAPYFGIASGHHAIFKHRSGFYIGSYFLEGESSVRTFPAKAEQDFSLRFANGPYVELCQRLGFAPPKIEFDRIRRVNTGIRPYRPDGPRVEIDEGLLVSSRGVLRVVHNYGHGAHGWTIGFATSEDSVNLAEVRGWLT